LVQKICPHVRFWLSTKKLGKRYNSAHADKIENFDDNFGREKALKSMRKYAAAFSSNDSALKKSGWAYNVGVDDTQGYLSLFDKLTKIENKGGIYSQFAQSTWKNISDNSPEIFKDSLNLWNEKYYGNKGTKSASQSRRVAAIISKERLAQINKIFKEHTGSDLCANPIISISEKQFEHSVRFEEGRTEPSKVFYGKIAQALETGEIKYSPKYKGGENSVIIEFENHGVVVYRNGEVYTFYEIKSGQ
jgi:hypothetical protein